MILTAAADHADLLVVGHRHLGRIASVVLGSVSQRCAQHARNPVMIVPPAAAPGS